jgi:hypothetical protein
MLLIKYFNESSLLAKPLFPGKQKSIPINPNTVCKIFPRHPHEPVDGDPVVGILMLDNT